MADMAFGFVDLRAYFRNRIVDIPGLQEKVREAIDRTVARHNDEANRFLAGLASPVVVAKQRYIMPGGDGMQRIGADDNPLPRVTYQGFDVGFPIRGYGNAMGTNRVSRQMITVEDANDIMQETRIADKNELIDQMLAAILTKEAYVFEDLPMRGMGGTGEVTVKGLASGDSDLYLNDRGRSIRTDDHYFAQTAAISPSENPLPMLRKAITEHGPNPDANVIMYVATDLVADIENLPGFVERTDSQLIYGANRDRLSNIPDRGFGDEVIGRVDRSWIVETERLPDGYIVAHAQGQQPLGQREYPATPLRGLFTETNNVNGNHIETRHLRFVGFGCRNRVAAAAIQIGSATYQTPDTYAAPLA